MSDREGPQPGGPSKCLEHAEPREGAAKKDHLNASCQRKEEAGKRLQEGYSSRDRGSRRPCTPGAARVPASQAGASRPHSVPTGAELPEARKNPKSPMPPSSLAAGSAGCPVLPGSPRSKQEIQAGDPSRGSKQGIQAGDPSSAPSRPRPHWGRPRSSGGNPSGRPSGSGGGETTTENQLETRGSAAKREATSCTSCRLNPHDQRG